MRYLIAIFFFLSAFPDVMACECTPLSFEEETQSANYIFHGKVVSVNGYTHTIEILETWKGVFTTNTFQLMQGRNSCERQTFQLNKEYLFYVQSESVFNCSRTREYSTTMDMELLDLKFKSMGDRQQIESETLTMRELEFLKPKLDNRNLTLTTIPIAALRFAINQEPVNKWSFLNVFDEYQLWTEMEFRIVELELKNGSKTWVLWTGENWRKSSRRLRKKL